MTKIRSSYVYDEKKRCYVPVSAAKNRPPQRTRWDRLKRTLTTVLIVAALLAGVWLAIAHIMGSFAGGGLLDRDARDPSILRSP